ncbi:MAG: hypothetical protein ACR2HA_14030 [Nocardioides sp.]
MSQQNRNARTITGAIALGTLAAIDSNVSGQTWKWRLVHDGSLSAKGTKTTSGASGSFEVRRVVVNSSGTDTLVFRAPAAGVGRDLPRDPALVRSRGRYSGEDREGDLSRS